MQSKDLSYCLGPLIVLKTFSYPKSLAMQVIVPMSDDNETALYGFLFFFIPA